ncbi:MAG TPA: hypothetical protein VGE37_10360 [Archangium sp.]
MLAVFALRELRLLGLSPEVRGVLETRCTEDPHVEEAAARHQRAFWDQVLSGKATQRELEVVLEAGYCGAPHKSLCWVALGALERDGDRFISEVRRLRPDAPVRLDELCEGEFPSEASAMLRR